MKKYRYEHDTESRFSIGETEYFLQQGNDYELPSNHSYIRALVEQGYLIPLPTQKPVKSTKRV